MNKWTLVEFPLQCSSGAVSSCTGSGTRLWTSHHPRSIGQLSSILDLVSVLYGECREQEFLRKTICEADAARQPPADAAHTVAGRRLPGLSG